MKNNYKKKFYFCSYTNRENKHVNYGETGRGAPLNNGTWYFQPDSDIKVMIVVELNDLYFGPPDLDFPS